MQAIKNKLSELTEEMLEGTDCFLVEVRVIPGNKVEVYLDSDTFVAINFCAKISRHLEAFLDESLALTEKYKLEVSSAGMENPLVMDRQFVKHKGKQVTVTLLNGQKKEGVLGSIVDNHLELEEFLPVKAKHLKNETQLIKLALSDIKQTKRIIKF